MEHVKATIRARLMLARVYAEQGWTELAQVQIKLAKREWDTYQKERTCLNLTMAA